MVRTTNGKVKEKEHTSKSEVGMRKQHGSLHGVGPMHLHTSGLLKTFPRLHISAPYTLISCCWSI